MSLYSALDSAIHKAFGGKMQVSLPEFQKTASNLVSKSFVREGIRDYFHAQGSSHRIIGLLCYSEAGTKYLVDLVEKEGMPASRLYASLLFDGGYWKKEPSVSPILRKISSSSELWSFSPEDLLWQYNRITSFPGFLGALVSQMRDKGRIEEAILSLPLSTLKDVIKHNPEVFRHEISSICMRDFPASISDEKVDEILGGILQKFVSKDNSVELLVCGFYSKK